MVRTALIVLLRPLLQAGQMRDGDSEADVGLESEEDVLKVIGTRDLRDKGCE